jgi:ABC-2 type transport system ATP-binding protein
MSAGLGSRDAAPGLAIRTSGLWKLYGRTTGIADLGLGVGQGEIFGFLGPNGAGKTTTIRLLLGLLRPSRGSVDLLGQDLHSHLPGILRRIGYLPGEFGLYRDLSGSAYLRHLLRLRRGRRCDEAKLEDLKARFPIDFDRPIRTYSKGMKQIVGIIQAFAHDPELLILDEPTSGLDPLKQEQFYELALAEKPRGRTIFFSSHVLSEVERICDRVAIVREGRLLSVDDVGGYRARLGKRVRIRARTEEPGLSGAIARLPGAHGLRSSGREVEFHFTGPVQELLRAVAPLDLEDFSCEDPDIEDLFFQHSREGAGSS